MPTVTWKSERRRSRAIGSSGVAASANGSTRGPSRRNPSMIAALARFMSAWPPAPARYRSRCRMRSARAMRQLAEFRVARKMAVERRARYRRDRRRPIAAREEPSDGVHQRQRGRARRDGEDDRRPRAGRELRERCARCRRRS